MSFSLWEKDGLKGRMRAGTPKRFGMPALTRPVKITFGEMRSSGVRGLLVYCANYRCAAVSQSSALIDGGTIFACQTLTRCLFVRPAGQGAPTSGLIHNLCSQGKTRRSEPAGCVLELHLLPATSSSPSFSFCLSS